jgi:N-acetylglucosaminyldiphosphoundecaprenol N-acetyl-beta-D-mannosaminyltransferase
MGWIFFVQLVSSGKRMGEWTASLILLVLLVPVLAGLYGIVRLQGGRLERVPRLGRWCEPFYEYRFAVPPHGPGRFIMALHLHRLPALFNILKGDMSFIGPRVVSPGEISPREHTARKRYNVRPGLVCLWWIRRRANIAYGSEVDADSEYVDTYSLWGDVGITLRSIPAILYGEGVATAPDELTVLGLPIHNLTMSEAVERIRRYLEGGAPRQVCFVNADCANIAYRNAAYRQVLQQAALSLADGIGLKLAGKLLARDIKQNVNGTDLFPRLCDMLAQTGAGVYLLGARPGIAGRVRDWMLTHYPGIRVCGAHHGYFSPAEEPQVIAHIAGSGAALLLVAFGAPRQDLWIHQHLRETGAVVAMGVGGLFDFYSGRTPRAPLWLREMGMEWLFRLYKEPRRMWKRYGIGNALFLVRVMKEKYLGSVH